MLDDLRLACRRLKHSPGFTLVSILTLALAIGANTAIFTVADAVLFRALPYADPDRLYVVRAVDAKTGERSPSVPFDYIQAIQEHHSGIAGAALRSTTIFTTHPTPGGAESVEVLFAAPDYFQVLGVRPVRGRLFDASDVAEGSHVVVLSYESWQRRFGGDESIIGRQVQLRPGIRTVIGVLPARFIFPSQTLRRIDQLTGPAEFVFVAPPPAPGRKTSLLMAGATSNAIVRLKPGVTREQVQAELDSLSAGVRASRPKDMRAIVLDDLRSLLFPTGRQILALLLVSAGLVLLIGCINLANTLTARINRRQHELAVYAALGASRLRLMRPLFAETLIVGSVSAAIAVGVTAVTFDTLAREVPPAAYGRAFIGVDARVAVFSLILGVAGGVLFAVLPAWRLSRLDVQAVMRRAHSRLRTGRAGIGRSMVTAQVTVAIIVVVGAVTSARNLIAILNEPLGFNPQNVITVDASPPVKDLTAYFRRAVDVVSHTPDVVSAGAGTTTPFYNLAANEAPYVFTTPFREVEALPGYLETLQVPVREGRLPARDDVLLDLEPAVVSQSAARRLFADRHPVGQTYKSADGRSFRIVAVVQDEIGSTDKIGALVYLIPREIKRGRPTLVVRTRTRSAVMLENVRRAVVPLVPPTEPVAASWMSDSIGALNTYRNPRFQTIVLGSFGALALGLSALGIFAVIAAVVASRTREMGIRLAIGAAPRTLVAHIMSEAFVPIAAGIVIGTLAAQLLSRIAQTEIAGIHTGSLDALAISAIVVLGAAAVAAYVPARRASQVDPVVVLRAE